MMPHPAHIGLTLLTAGLLAPMAALAAAPPAQPEFDHYQIISHRNIFDQNRSANSGSRSSQSRDDQEPRPHVDSFALVGTLLTEQGRFAFFDGSSPDYRKALSPDEVIAGHTIAQVTQDHVTLQLSNSPPIHLPIGMALNRQDQGPWQLTEHSSSSSDSNTHSRDVTQGTSASDEAVLKRLLQRREADGSSEASPAASNLTQRPPSPTPEPVTETDPVLKRLQEKREQELRK